MPSVSAAKRSPVLVPGGKASAAVKGIRARGRNFARVIIPRQPAQMIVLGFAAAVAVGTGLLMLPIAKEGPGGATFLEALFTATSSVCVTGLITVDTPIFWTGFGQAVILALIQLGGSGVMSSAALLGVLMARRLGLRSRLLAATETKSDGPPVRCAACFWACWPSAWSQKRP